ncbi:MAG TPA: restriction endonuclease subunit S [Methanocorpusculum sp.]|nr:restriction endonuclease subunit S [Methanocorpusculum sp.]
MKSCYRPLGELIRLVDERNSHLVTTRLLGINIDKFFMPSVANVIGTDLSRYKLLRKGLFACNPMHVGRDERLPVALFQEEQPAIVSPAYFMFEVLDSGILDEEYLMLWFRRAEFDRKCWFHTDGSVRGGLTWDDFCRILVRVPDLEEQKKIVHAYKVIEDRINLKKRINEVLDDIAYTIYKDTFINNNGRNWKSGTLSELLSVQYGKDHKELKNGLIPLYGSGGIMRNVEKSLYNDVSVLIPRVGSLSNVMYVDEPFWSIESMFYTKITKPYAAKFIYYFIRSQDLAGMDTGSAVPIMSSEIIHSMPLEIPDDDTLIEFDAHLEPIYKRIKSNNHECMKLTESIGILLSNIS